MGSNAAKKTSRKSAKSSIGIYTWNIFSATAVDKLAECAMQTIGNYGSRSTRNQEAVE